MASAPCTVGRPLSKHPCRITQRQRPERRLARRRAGCHLCLGSGPRIACERIPVGIDVISFADEEGTWLACLGSRVFCGEISGSLLADLQSKSGERLSDRLQQLGLRERPLARFDPQRHRAYLEAHIEQGPRLELKGSTLALSQPS